MKRTAFTFLILAFASVNVLFGQTNIDWKTLEDVSFTEKYNDEFATYILIAKFGESVQKLKGKTVRISGYIIPLDVEQNQYVLSANPFASCFFCGGAGPETVIDLYFTEKVKYRTDQYVTIEGVLDLNKDDVYKLNYILDKAKKVD